MFVKNLRFSSQIFLSYKVWVKLAVFIADFSVKISLCILTKISIIKNDTIAQKYVNIAMVAKNSSTLTSMHVSILSSRESNNWADWVLRGFLPLSQPSDLAKQKSARKCGLRKSADLFPPSLFYVLSASNGERKGGEMSSVMRISKSLPKYGPMTSDYSRKFRVFFFSDVCLSIRSRLVPGIALYVEFQPRYNSWNERIENNIIEL